MTAQKKPRANLTLKVAIVRSGQTARRIALRAGLGEVRLSAIVRGRLVASETDKIKIAKALRLPQDALFPSGPSDAARDAEGAA